ncbi:MAG: glucose-6-phosphate isomerase, partial [Gemmatimonadetes bacterium]|nr:glucose-6-phosphate isomerase [Gemmatimonadota bacterium]
AALVGIDTTALLAGAREIVQRAASSNLAVNAAGVFALLQWRAHSRHGQGIHVMMPYSDALRDIAPWFAQLWAESLGKIDATGTSVGPTPVAALGATDQHSQIQLYMEGPADKTVTFLAEGARDVDARIPAPPADLAELAYLGGHSLGALLDAERAATAQALARAGRPNQTITLDRVDAQGVGSLLMFLMHATIYAGALYRVNPLDQPGVEAGKVLAKASLAAGAAAPSGGHWVV